MEDLAGLVKQTTNKQLYHSVRIGSTKVLVNLCYCLLMTHFFLCEVKAKSTMVIKSVLRCSELEAYPMLGGMSN